MRGEKDIVPVLLAGGADRNIADKEGKLPIDYSRNTRITQALSV